MIVYTTRTQQTDSDAATATQILTGITKVQSPEHAVIAPS